VVPTRESAVPPWLIDLMLWTALFVALFVLFRWLQRRKK